jgi:predicted transcriptional regulator
MSEEKSAKIEMTADIVAAYVSNNSVSQGDLPSLIQAIYKTINEIGTGVPAEAAPAQAPAVSIRRSITPDHLVCLEDGLKFKSLKRHLRTKFGMSPEEYRAKWGLPNDYPMVSPAYAASRSALAKASGLGQVGRQAAKPKPAGRGKKAVGV